MSQLNTGQQLHFLNTPLAKWAFYCASRVPVQPGEEIFSTLRKIKLVFKFNKLTLVKMKYKSFSVTTLLKAGINCAHHQSVQNALEFIWLSSRTAVDLPL